MEMLVTLIVAILGGGFLGHLLSYRKIKSEASLNETSEKKVVVSMALELTEELKQFYEIRVAFLEQRIAALEKHIEGLEATITELRNEK